MARPGTPPSARLAALRKAKERASSLSQEDRLTADPMAKLLAVRWPTLRGWCDTVEELAAYNAFVRGGNGIEWTFRPILTINALIDHFEAAKKKSEGHAQWVSQVITGTPQATPPAARGGGDEELTLSDMEKTLKITRMAREEAVAWGELINAEQARGYIRRFMASIQEAALRAAQDQDPNGRWDPTIRESFENATQNILLSIEKAGRDCLTQLGGG